MAGAASPKLEKPPSSQDGGPALQELWSDPHGDVALVSSIRRSPYHRNGKSWTSFAWRCFVDCFIHKNGNDTLSSSRFGASETLQGAQSPCVLCRGDRAGLGRKEPSRGLASPSPWSDPLSRRGPSPRDKSLARPRQAWEPLQAWRAWSLAKISPKM